LKAQRALAVWMNGDAGGTWSWSRTGTPVFQYENAWLGSPDVRAIVVFAGSRRPQATPRPEGQALFRQPAAGQRQDSCAHSGALPPRRHRGTRIVGRDRSGLHRSRAAAAGRRVAAVGRLLTSVTSDAVPGQEADDFDDFRISIAGAQENTALLKLDGQ
jgi:serine/threonine-protein kinase HipA